MLLNMKIVVLAGGLSPERNVSLSSGALVCQALRDRGHQVALVDLFFGLDDWDKEPEALYGAPIPEEFLHVSRQAPDLDQVRASRKTQSPSAIGPGVLDLCAGADVVYLALHGACGRGWPHPGCPGPARRALHRLGLSGLGHRHGQGHDQAAGGRQSDHPQVADRDGDGGECGRPDG